jgi:glycine/D-amino acid oxidase-like deaminating enzyme
MTRPTYPGPSLSGPPLSGIDRRRLLQGSAAGLGLIGLSGCATAGGLAPAAAQRPTAPRATAFRLAPVRARADRLFDITVCLRPFRAAGPRLDTEMIGDTLVVHNYGHGGSGWSLSWGSAEVVVAKAMARGQRDIAVIGCGALGLTAATTAQKAGAQVTIYAQEPLAKARSSRATGSWTPSSRICLESVAGPSFATLWEQMARTSHKTYRSYLGLPGKPVEWIDRYTISDRSRDAPAGPFAREALDFAEYDHLINDLRPRTELMPPGSTPFDAPFVYRSESMMFNIADYGHILMNDFYAAGGRFQATTFHSPSEFAALKEKVVINCTGYGARALCRDDSIVPVRGQIGWLIPQAEVDYGLTYREVSVLSRTDGIVVQAVEGGDMKGYGDDHEVVDRAESVTAVAKIEELFAQRWRG